MRVLVTGGTGVVGKPAVDALLARGHLVRLLSRNAREDVAQWPEGVEPWEASVGDDAATRGAADGCEAVLHIAGIVAEDPPEVTFQRVNVDGTRELVEEAQRAGARRFIYVSSLGADQGESDYHRSKREAEQIVRGFRGEWMVLRPGNVYGPGDEVISTLLKMVRTLPVIPVIGSGDQPFQPMWAGDLGEALARSVDHGEPGSDYLLAGPEPTTVAEVLDLLAQITDNHPARIPVPGGLAGFGADLLERIGIDPPITRDQITMLEEGNVIGPGKRNALVEVFGVEPVPLREGLKLLADDLPEQLSPEGVGSLHRQRFWADIHGSSMGAAELIRVFQQEFGTLTPDGLIEVGTEPGTGSCLEPGATITLDIPVRGTMQVRVEEVAEDSITVATLGGHLLAGFIRFQARDHDDQRLRFEIVSYTRASNWLDWLGRSTVGGPLQHAAWESTVESVVARTGGQAPEGVETEDSTIAEEEAEHVEEWAHDLVMRRKREEADQPEEETSSRS